MLLQLDFLKYRSALQIKIIEGKQKIFDPVRKKFVVMTPEELLRQLTLQYLLQGMQYPINRVRSEIGIEVNGMPRRCDIVVFDQDVRPWLLVECKSPKVPVDQAVMSQAVRYNTALGVPFVAITNGLQTYCCGIDYAAHDWHFLEDFPEWGKKPGPVGSE
jgi:Type I restriction enzyme R protein N terminus (HSDR_N)